MADGNRDKSEARALGKALAVLRARSGLSQEKAGEAAGMGGEGWRKYEAGATGIFKPATQQRLTAAVDANVEDLLEERDRLLGERRASAETPAYLTPQLLHIRNRAQAGAFLAIDDLDQTEPKMSTTAADPRFPQADQWISEIGGDSMNQLGILDGDLVHCVFYEAARGQPQTGDIVEVERVRYQGALRELTIKQVEVVGNQILLWPRSNNPRWRDPIVITDGVPEGEEMEVQIRGLVLAIIRRI